MPSARDFSRSMGLGGSDTAAILSATAPAATPVPVPQTPEPVTAQATGKVDEHGRAHGAPGTEVAGQYLPTQPGETPAAAPGSGGEPSATPEAEPQADGTATATPEVPDGYVRIEIPEALQRNFGREQIVPKDQEQFFRFNLNNHVKNAEFEQVKRQAKEAETLRQQLDQERSERLRVQSGNEADGKFRQTPEYRRFTETFQGLKQAEADGSVAEGTASQYWKDAVQPAYKAFADGEYQAQTEAVRAQDYDQAGQAWASEAWSRASLLPVQLTGHPQFQRIFEETVSTLNYGLENGHHPEVTDSETAHGAFRRMLASRLMALPEVSQAVQGVEKARQQAVEKARADAAAKAATAKATREAEDQRRKEAEQAALNAATNPMGNVSPGQVIRGARGGQAPINAKNFDRLMSRR